MLAEVYDSSPEGTDRAMNRFAICLLMDTDSFPPVFLVIEFQCCTIGGQNKAVRGGFWEATELSCPHFFLEGDVLQFELDRLFCIVSFPFNSVFSDSHEVIKRVWAVPDSPYPISTRNWGTSVSMGSIFLVGGSSLPYPSIMIWRAGRNFSEPIILVGLFPTALDIVCPTAVIALVTVAAWTCRPRP